METPWLLWLVTVSQLHRQNLQTRSNWDKTLANHSPSGCETFDISQNWRNWTCTSTLQIYCKKVATNDFRGTFWTYFKFPCHSGNSLHLPSKVLVTRFLVQPTLVINFAKHQLVCKWTFLPGDCCLQDCHLPSLGPFIEVFCIILWWAAPYWLKLQL